MYGSTLLLPDQRVLHHELVLLDCHLCLQDHLADLAVVQRLARQDVERAGALQLRVPCPVFGEELHWPPYSLLLGRASSRLQSCGSLGQRRGSARAELDAVP